MDAVASAYLAEGGDQDVAVEAEAAALEVFTVESDLDRYAAVVAAVDLRPAGKAGNQLVNSTAGTERDEVVLIEERGTRADEAEVAAQNAPELR